MLERAFRPRRDLDTVEVAFAAWLNGMGNELYVMWRTDRRDAGVEPEVDALEFGVIGGFCTVMLNGVVEYNFGDAEIFMILCFLLGLSALVGHHPPRPAAPGTA